MQFLLQVLLFFFCVINSHATGTKDRNCGQDPANIWLDVVIVVDNSKAMTSKDLQLVSTNIVEVWDKGTRIGTNYDDPRTTRVGLVTYNQDATVAADLNKFQSFQDLQTGAKSALSVGATTDQSFLAKGLVAAEQLLTTGRSNNHRSNYKPLIIVYAATYQSTNDSDPVIVADRLKNNGINIAVVDMIKIRKDKELGILLSNIASSDYFYPYSWYTVDDLQGAIFHVNCYCRDNWTDFHALGLDYKSGVCIRAFNQTASWQVAKLSCQSLVANGYLVTDFTDDKHQFLQSLFQNTTGSTFGYHIGLTYANGGWYWQQPVGQQLIQLDNLPDYIYWNIGFPRSPASMPGVATVTAGVQTGWENINVNNINKNYICEVNACDTDNYCS